MESKGRAFLQPISELEIKESDLKKEPSLVPSLGTTLSTQKVYYVLYKSNKIYKLANFKTLEEANICAETWKKNKIEALVIETIKETPKSVILGFYNKKKVKKGF